MNILLWILQILAAFLYLSSGVMKVFMFDKVSHDVPSFGALPRNAWTILGIVELVCTVALILPAVDHLGQLPAKSAFLFGFDPEAARAMEDNAAALAADSARSVLGEFAARARTQSDHVTPETFKHWMNEIKAATGVKGKELFHPIRIALTGAHSGPEFDKIIPLIEEGAALGLGIPNVQERVAAFTGA